MMYELLIIFIIGLLVFVHEAGHLFMAKLNKIPIARFSIGFGPILYKKKYNQTEYALSLIPLGGYVLPQIENEELFFQLPVYKRILFSIGGPLFNLILSLILFSLLNVFSKQMTFYNIIIEPIIHLYNTCYHIMYSLIKMFKDIGNLSGVIGIVKQGSSIIQKNLYNIFGFSALLSVNFAVFNLLPIPILDGGKILLYLTEKIHPVFKKIHVPLAIGGWIFMLVLLIYVTFQDIIKIYI